MRPDAIVERTVQTPCGELAVERPVRVADAATMVIFGATGDLAKRKLLPALCNLNRDRLLPERFAVVALGRDEMTTDTYRENVSRDLQEFGTVTTERLKCGWLETIGTISGLVNRIPLIRLSTTRRRASGPCVAAHGRQIDCCVA